METFLYRVISIIALGAAILTAIGLPGLEDKWCIASIPTYLSITFLIISFDDPWAAKEDRTDLIALFWPALIPMVIGGIIYVALMKLFGKEPF